MSQMKVVRNVILYGFLTKFFKNFTKFLFVEHTRTNFPTLGTCHKSWTSPPWWGQPYRKHTRKFSLQDYAEKYGLFFFSFNMEEWRMFCISFSVCVSLFIIMNMYLFSKKKRYQLSGTLLFINWQINNLQFRVVLMWTGYRCVMGQ